MATSEAGNDCSVDQLVDVSFTPTLCTTTGPDLAASSERERSGQTPPGILESPARRCPHAFPRLAYMTRSWLARALSRGYIWDIPGFKTAGAPDPQIERRPLRRRTAP